MVVKWKSAAACIAVAASLGLFATAAHATPLFELEWTATTGLGAPGGTTIDAAVGDVLTLDIRVVYDTGLAFASISLDYDQAAFSFVSGSAEECPVFIPGLCLADDGFDFSNILSPIVPGVTDDGDILASFDAFAIPGFLPGAGFTTLGRAEFEVIDAIDGAMISTLLLLGLDGVTDGSQMFFDVEIPTVALSINVAGPPPPPPPPPPNGLPEPASLWLFGFGLLGLAFFARRRRLAA